MATKYVWAKNPRPPQLKLARSKKDELLAQVQAFVAAHFTAHMQPPPKNPRFNYVTGYFVKWQGSYIVVFARYACPSPNAISPSFDAPLARLGCFPGDRFSLWARRHTDEWIVIEDGITLNKCFEALRTNPWFEQ
jgi:hypothetical protein